jgi:hypothetical protein
VWAIAVSFTVITLPFCADAIPIFKTVCVLLIGLIFRVRVPFSARTVWSLLGLAWSLGRRRWVEPSHHSRQHIIVIDIIIIVVVIIIIVVVIVVPAATVALACVSPHATSCAPTCTLAPALALACGSAATATLAVAVLTRALVVILVEIKVVWERHSAVAHTVIGGLHNLLCTATATATITTTAANTAFVCGRSGFQKLLVFRLTGCGAGNRVRGVSVAQQRRAQ